LFATDQEPQPSNKRVHRIGQASRSVCLWRLLVKARQAASAALRKPLVATRFIIESNQLRTLLEKALEFLDVIFGPAAARVPTK
jgi:hypothetical protein